MSKHEIQGRHAAEDAPDARDPSGPAGVFLHVAVDHHLKIWEAAERRGDDAKVRLHRGLMTAYHFVEDGMKGAGLSDMPLDAEQKRTIDRTVNASVEPVMGDVPVGENVARIDKARLEALVRSFANVERKDTVAGAARATGDEVEKVLGA